LHNGLWLMSGGRALAQAFALSPGRLRLVSSDDDVKEVS